MKVSDYIHIMHETVLNYKYHALFQFTYFAILAHNCLTLVLLLSNGKVLCISYCLCLKKKMHLTQEIAVRIWQSKTVVEY